MSAARCLRLEHGQRCPLPAEPGGLVCAVHAVRSRRRDTLRPGRPGRGVARVAGQAGAQHSARSGRLGTRARDDNAGDGCVARRCDRVALGPMHPLCQTPYAANSSGVDCVAQRSARVEPARPARRSPSPGDGPMRAPEWWRARAGQWTADPPARRWQDVDALLVAVASRPASRRARHQGRDARQRCRRSRAVGFRAAGDVAVAEMRPSEPGPAAGCRLTLRSKWRRSHGPGARSSPARPCPAARARHAPESRPTIPPAVARPGSAKSHRSTWTAARAVPVTAVARMLGLELDASGKRARCPFHDDRPAIARPARR